MKHEKKSKTKYVRGTKRQRELNGEWKIDLEYYPDAGGRIVIWNNEPDHLRGAERLPHVWQLDENKEWATFEEVHFMDKDNAIMEYKGLRTVDAILNICQRNA